MISVLTTELRGQTIHLTLNVEELKSPLSPISPVSCDSWVASYGVTHGQLQLSYGVTFKEGGDQEGGFGGELHWFMSLHPGNTQHLIGIFHGSGHIFLKEVCSSPERNVPHCLPVSVDSSNTITVVGQHSAPASPTLALPSLLKAYGDRPLLTRWNFPQVGLSYDVSP